VVLGQIDYKQVGHLSLFFKFGQLLQKNIYPRHVWDLHLPASVVWAGVTAQCFNVYALLERNCFRLVLVISIKIFPVGGLGEKDGKIKLAIVAKRQPAHQQVIPQEWRRRKGKGVCAKVVAAAPVAKCLFLVVGRDALRGPLMPIRADDAAAIVVVQQCKLFGQRVVIGRYVAAIDAERGVAIGLFDVAKNLVVRAIFLYHVNDVIKDRRLPQRLGYGHGLCLTAISLQCRQRLRNHPKAQHVCRHGLQRVRAWHLQTLHRTPLPSDVPFLSIFFPLFTPCFITRALALGVGNKNGLAVRRHARGEPASRYEP